MRVLAGTRFFIMQEISLGRYGGISPALSVLPSQLKLGKKAKNALCEVLPRSGRHICKEIFDSAL